MEFVGVNLILRGDERRKTLQGYRSILNFVLEIMCPPFRAQFQPVACTFLFIGRGRPECKDRQRRAHDEDEPRCGASPQRFLNVAWSHRVSQCTMSYRAVGAR